jgi:hypothetical protein
MRKKVIKHLKGDIKGYKKEIKEDKELIKELKGKKMAKKTAKCTTSKKIGKVMREYKAGKLHSGSKKGPKVKSRKQAIAIALSEARDLPGKKPSYLRKRTSKKKI